MVDAILLRPLPYKDPARLVFIWQTLPEQSRRSLGYRSNHYPWTWAPWPAAQPYPSDIARFPVLALFLNLRPVLEAANVFTLVWYSVVHFDALKLPKEKRLVWPVVSWLGLAGCLALFASLPVWALGTGGVTLAALTAVRWLVLGASARRE